MDNTFGIPDNDSQRIETLKKYKILNTAPEYSFDNLAKLATQIFKVPIALISLVDKEQVFFKANIGLGTVQTIPRGLSLCSVAILSPDLTVFENTTEEPSLPKYPDHTGDADIKFYAGAPLTTPDGFLIGTLCIQDKTPRIFSVAEREMLKGLATVVMDQIDMRLRAILDLEKQQLKNEEIAAVNEEMQTSNEELMDMQSTLEQTILALSHSEARAKYMLADAPVAIGVLTGEDLIIESANGKLLELWGKTSGVINQPLSAALPELEGQPFFGILADVLRSGIPFFGQELKAELIREGVREQAYFNFVYHPIKDGHQQVTGIMIVATEVTEQVLSRIQINTAEERLRLALEAADMGSWYIDPETNALEYNAQLAKIFGYDQQEPMSYQAAIAQVTPEFQSKIALAIEEAISKGEKYDITYSQQRFNDKTIVWLRSIGKANKDTEGIYRNFSGVVMDVTAQVKYRQKIEDLNDELGAINEEITSTNEELLSANLELKKIQKDLLIAHHQLADSEAIKNIAIEQAQLGIWYIDAKTRDFIPSDRLKEFFGYFPNEEMPYDDAIEFIREDFREQVRKEVESAITTGKSYDMEYPIIVYRSQQLRWVRATGRLNPAQNGLDAYFTGTVVDITEQKEDDQRKNDFISMVSHELKTPLTSIMGYIQIMALKAAKSEDSFASGVLQRAEQQTRKMTTMINGFLNMKRMDTGKIPIYKSHFDMAELIREIEEETEATISKYRMIFAPIETTFLEADRDKIGQVINNLISNAVKYSPEGSTITIACINVGKTVQLSIKDQGMGIDEVDQHKLFDRFYRVERKEVEKINGFGIGLYLCDEIVRRHAGKIWVESVRNVGSTFYFSLPQ